MRWSCFLLVSIVCLPWLVAGEGAAAAAGPAAGSAVDGAVGREDLRERVRQLEDKLAKLDQREQSWTNFGFEEHRRTRAEMFSADVRIVIALMFAAAAVCMLWAQSTGRNPWVLLVCGFSLHALAVVVMLVKNGKDAKHRTQVAEAGHSASAVGQPSHQRHMVS